MERLSVSYDFGLNKAQTTGRKSIEFRKNQRKTYVDFTVGIR